MTTIQELLRLQTQLTQQIEDARRAELAGVVAQIQTYVQQYRLGINDVFPDRVRHSRTLDRVAPKYRDPLSGGTWSGRGKSPVWIKGRDRNQFLI